MSLAEPWDYLIITASNEQQAEAYRNQLELRQRLDYLLGFRHAMVVADPGGRRVGSGGSTIGCLLEVLQRETAEQPDERSRPEAWRRLLGGLRILILHAGGDSRRLPAYGPCGKIFLPLPVWSDGAIGVTLFDRQLPVYRDLPAMPDEAGQVVIASGDVLLEFLPEEVAFAPQGMTGLGSPAAPEAACKHGVYCLGSQGRVRRFLQKPSVETQVAEGAVDGYGESVLDIGVISFDADTAVRLLECCGVSPDTHGNLAWHGPIAECIERHGLDFYRELCCALGTDTLLAPYQMAVRASGCGWDTERLERWFKGICSIPFHVQVLRHCRFLHFGTTREIIASGRELLRGEERSQPASACLSINNQIGGAATLAATDAWVEGCAIGEPIRLSGGNVVVGVDVDQSLQLPPQACLDVLPGTSRDGRPVWFIRCYREDDQLASTPAERATLCGHPLVCWLEGAEAAPEEMWDRELSPERRNAWNARLFPAESEASGYRRWLWMFSPSDASPAQLCDWRLAERYSLEEMAVRADQARFHQRRMECRGTEVRRSLRRYFRADSGFSAADLAELLGQARDRELWLSELVGEARWQWENSDQQPPEERFTSSRILHSLGSALVEWSERPASPLGQLLPGLEESLAPADAEWLVEMGFKPDLDAPLEHWAERLHAAAFEQLRQQIVGSVGSTVEPPRSVLRKDEICWGRAPVRLDLAGGWTDTPPFSLEHGGCVLNVAVRLNTQPPIQVYARVTPEPVIRLRSIDVGSQVEIREWEELLDYESATGDFSLVKAALVLSGFSPKALGADLAFPEMLARFGGGLELTTMAAVPKGSGLGTSSIMGAVLVGVIHRVLGRPLSPIEVFHAVLRLEQALTTGGGWQDQIGGVVGGLKLITTQPGMIPEPTIRYLPDNVLTPTAGSAPVLLYYTGITRLAKNILQEVVGRYLDRNRQTVATLRQIQQLAPETADALARRDYAEFGKLVGWAWDLNKQLDASSTTEEIECLLERIGRFIHGAKLSGAGGGGFLVLVCKSEEDATGLKAELRRHPLNEKARFFDFEMSNQGLAVNVC
jgi:galactokinase/mevalonate kinase-like predicted kinase